MDLEGKRKDQNGDFPSNQKNRSVVAAEKAPAHKVQGLLARSGLGLIFNYPITRLPIYQILRENKTACIKTRTNSRHRMHNVQGSRPQIRVVSGTTYGQRSYIECLLLDSG